MTGILDRAVSESNANRTFLVFLLVHCLMWTLLPALTRHDLDIDSLIQFAWGQEWQWSYAQQPPLIAWIVAGFLDLTGISRVNYILLSQLNIAVAMVAIWSIARDCLPPTRALAAVLLLEFVPFYSFLSQSFNHTALLISCWAVTTAFLYFALARGRLAWWILAGLGAALSMLAKYYSIMLLGAIGFLLLFTRAGRASLATPGPWLGLVSFGLLFWFHLDFVLSRDVGTVSHIGDYLSFESLSSRMEALKFLAAQVVYLLPAFVVFAWSLSNGGSRGALRRIATPFLMMRDAFTGPRAGLAAVICTAVMLVPLVVTTVFGFLLGVGPSSRWGGSLWGTIGILLLLQLGSGWDEKASRRVVLAAFVAAVLLPLSMLLVAAAGIIDSRHDYPGRELGALVTEAWTQETGTRLGIVGGGRLPTYSMAFNSPDHPSTITSLNFASSPWVTLSDIDEEGIALLCLSEDAGCTSAMAAMFPGFEPREFQAEGSAGLFSRSRAETLSVIFVPPGNAHRFVPPGAQ